MKNDIANGINKLFSKLSPKNVFTIKYLYLNQAIKIILKIIPIIKICLLLFL